MNAPTPRPAPVDLPQPTSGLQANMEDVLRFVLARLDASRTDATTVRSALAAAGVSVSAAWAADWLNQAREIRAGVKS